MQTSEVYEYSLPNLPNELWLIIFDHLSCNDLQNVKLVCKTWRNLIQFTELRDKFFLVITQKNWPTIRNCIKKYGELTPIIRYKNIYFDSITFIQSDLSLFQYWRENVENLKLQDCHTTILYPDYLFDTLKILDIDNTSLGYPQCSKFVSPKLTTLRLQSVHDLSSTHSLELIKRMHQTIRVLEIELFDINNTNLMRESLQLLNNLEILQFHRPIPYNVLKAIVQTLPEEARLRYIYFMQRLDTDILHIVLKKWRNTLQYLDIKYNINMVKKNSIHIELSDFKNETNDNLMLHIFNAMIMSLAPKSTY